MNKFFAVMKELLFKYNHSIQKELFLSFILINTITMIICIAILFSFTSNILTETNKESSVKEFQQISYNLGIVTKEVENIIDVLASSNQLTNQLGIQSLTETTNILDTRDTFYLFGNYTRYYPYIESIYCYLDDGPIIGKDNSSNLFISNKQIDQISNNDYIANTTNFVQNVFKGNPKFISIGCFTSRNFLYSINPINKNTGDINYITFVKSFHMLSSEPYAVLVNISESYFRSLYNISDGSTYLVDNTGRIISNSNLTLIGTISSAYLSNKISGEIGSYFFNNKQIVYCNVPNSSFLLIKETEMNDITKNISVIRNIFIYVLLFNFLCILYFSRLFIRRIISPLNKLSISMQKIEIGDFTQKVDEIPNNEIGTLSKQFNKMSSSIVELLHNNRLIEEEKRKIEIEALHAQINPHFLYNTLNTLKWMALLSNSNNVADGLTSMGKLLRHIYGNRGVTWPLGEEYDFLQNYTKIMNYRFGGAVSVNIDFEDGLMVYSVLTFMLQPILENAFTHGLNEQGNSGEITVTAIALDSEINFAISDNGEGISEEKLKDINHTMATGITMYGNKGMSISNVNKRIKLHYGEKYGVSIISAVGRGTTVSIAMPKVKI